MIHGIHAGAFRQNPFKVIGFGHSVNDFGGVKFGQPYLETCEACHIPGAYQVPLQSNVLGTTTVTNSILTATQKTVDNLPDNNLRTTPTAAVCSACHDSAATRTHMQQNGASFNALQLNIDSGAVKELCANCHGTGKPLDVVTAHLEGLTPASARLTSISQNSGFVSSSVPVKITGVNLSSAGLTVTGVGVTVSNLVRTATLLTATLNIAANATFGATYGDGPRRRSRPAIHGQTPGAGPIVGVAIGRHTGRDDPSHARRNEPDRRNPERQQHERDIVERHGRRVADRARRWPSVLPRPAYVILTATTAGGVSDARRPGDQFRGFRATLASITPPSGMVGTAFSSAIAGTNLSGATLSIGGAGMTASNLVATATQITATLALASNATAGARTISATTAAGTSNSVNFTVNPLLPALSSITPASGTAGTSVPVTITGTNSDRRYAEHRRRRHAQASNLVATATQITATLALASNATAGARTISATTAAGTSNSVNFTVNPLPPALSSITPASGTAGTAFPSPSPGPI